MKQPGDTPSQRMRRWAALPWLVLLIGMPVSAYLFVTLTQAVEEVARSRFEREASEAKGLIEVRIHFYADILYGLRALFATQEEVSRVDFHRYVTSLDLKQRYPGFDLVNFAAYVPAAERDRFEAAVQRDTSLDGKGYPEFVIKPPGARPDYHVMVYLEPMQEFRFAFGLDIAANPALDAAPRTLVGLQHTARDTGRLTASGMPIRIRGAKEYVGLAMRLAVYRAGMPVDTVEDRRAAYVGSVGAGFNVQNLMKGALHEGMAQYMRFLLYDAGPASEPRSWNDPVQERLLFDSDPSKGAAQKAAAANDSEVFARALPIEVGGRVWRVHFMAPRSAIIERVDAFSPWVVLAGGIITSLLLAGLFYSLASSHSRAITIATEMTSSLRDSEANLVEAHALLNDAQKLAGVGCCHYEPRSGRVVWSDELYRIHGVEPPAFAPTHDSTMALVHPEDRARWAATLTRALETGEPFADELRIVRPDGTVRHLRSLGEVMHDGAAAVSRMLWSVLDITEQKRTEDALRASADQLTALSRRLVEVQEAERRQLSRELHDRVGQNLTALSINLDMLRTSLDDGPNSRHAARLSDSTALLESTADSIEDVMSELRPPMLDDYGLYPALNWYARRFAERTGIAIEVLGTETSERVPEIEITLFRIAQEALNNVAKHANATHVQIELEQSEGACIMTVSDNGVGIDSVRVADSRPRRGLGMVTMRERTQAIGGCFTVRGVPGGGTQIEIEVPSHDDTHTHRG